MAKAPSTAAPAAPAPAAAPPPPESAPAKPAEPQATPGPDLKAALKQERDRNKKMRDELDRANLANAETQGRIKEIENSNLRETAPPAGPVGFTEADMADPMLLNQKMQTILASQREEIVKGQDAKAADHLQKVTNAAAAAQHKDALEREWGRYELTADDRSEMGRLARASYDRAVYDEGALGQNPTMEDARELIEQTVKMVSRFTVEQAEPAPAVAEPPQPAPASAGGEANHLTPGGKEPMSTDDIEDRVAKGVASFDAAQQQAAGKGG